MSTINVKCVDQVLAITNSPVVSSGDQNVDGITFDFDPSWDSYAKVAVFYRKKGEFYYSLLDNNKTGIPNEIVANAGTIYFGVMGINGNKTRTSQVLQYNIYEGIAVETIPMNPDLAQQILNELTEMRKTYGEGKFLEQNKKEQILFWIGTRAEYDAISEADLITNCYYIITDDIKVTPVQSCDIFVGVTAGEDKTLLDGSFTSLMYTYPSDDGEGDPYGTNIIAELNGKASDFFTIKSVVDEGGYGTQYLEITQNCDVVISFGASIRSNESGDDAEIDLVAGYVNPVDGSLDNSATFLSEAFCKRMRGTIQSTATVNRLVIGDCIGWFGKSLNEYGSTINLTDNSTQLRLQFYPRVDEEE